MEHTLKNFRIETDDRGVATAILDVPDRGMNVFEPGVIEELESLVSKWEHAKDIKAIIFKSGKASGFLAGADINVIESIRTPEEADAIIARGQNLFTRIERLPMPTFAVIHGPCLGGGLEFALACKYRIARDDGSTRLGLPETQLGVIPGWGGTQRLPRVVGVVKALEMILTAKKVPASAAKKMGLVHLAPSPEEFENAVKNFVETVIASPSSAAEVSSSPRRPLLTRLVNQSRFGRWVVFKGTAQRIANQVRHYPALEAALQAVKAGYRTPGQPGMDAERAAFCKVLFTPTCRNLIGLFFQREKARNVATWTKADEGAKPAPVGKLGVIGGGAMGAGIAQLAAYQGLEVVLREINQEMLDAGMSRIKKLFDEAVAKRRLSAEEAAAKLAAVKPTVDWAPLSDVDAVVEAVVEREDIKQDVFRELELHTPPEAVLATNTSSLSVRRLAESREHPERIAGLHFFNPVHRMELVEVVRTESTSPAAISRLVRLVKKLGKTPIVVEDSPGFVVNRILFPYLAEAVRMVTEGEEVTWIDRTLKRFGMPMGPLELLDQVGLDVAAHVAGGLGDVIPDPGPTAERLAAMVKAGWLGKKSGQGFYVYENGRKGKPTVWPETQSALAPINAPDTFATGLSLTELRLVLPLINEAARCLEEHIAAEAWMVDLAMVLGTGFAPFRGGPLKLADSLGIANVVTDMQTLAGLCGNRFTPCPLLLNLQQHQETFYTKGQGETEKRREQEKVGMKT